ncbi:ribulose-phosphate 3-epimerase [Candidatus Odyssella acanthamoebae]|uniref:Ribulose-phosphate 3-epimerase n=1 Tax=Candidatus Odyssella acanthamoebae TaxID=91604 RepID=A0A077B1S7_9PROT|nr:ribulose-phosphate 3-epimerase [Candidatus Paracaedibacter acanthamoebae]AIK96900.1 ribulose-phosphate 3-epimerase [Candidatus Paracaedibacter acanthamoebae]
MMSSIKISPSILSADILNLGDEVTSVAQSGADGLHVDVMDGRYVPNITYGPNLVAALRRVTDLPLDVHLMITPAQPHLKAFAQAGASIITIHPDADVHTHRLLGEIRSYGVKAGVALNPGVPASSIEPLLPFIDLILIMTVNPGFGGQSYISEMTDKIRQVRRLIDHSGRDIELEVDGGINAETAKQAIEAGATALVAGAAIFATKDNDYAATIAQLRGDRP